MKVIGESKLGLGDIIRYKVNQRIGVVTGVEVFVSFGANRIQYEIDNSDFVREDEIELMTGRPETMTVTDK